LALFLEHETEELDIQQVGLNVGAEKLTKWASVPTNRKSLSIHRGLHYGF